MKKYILIFIFVMINAISFGQTFFEKNKNV